MEAMRDDASDGDLLAATAAGDRGAVSVFYRRHVGAVLAYAVREARSAELGADVVAETFAAALVSADRYRPERGTGRAWLLGIAAHKLADARRRGRVEEAARRRLGMRSVVADDDDLEQIERRVSIDREALACELELLPPSQRGAVLGRVVGELSYDALAADLEVSPVTARQQVSRGLARLRQRMKERPQ